MSNPRNKTLKEKLQLFGKKLVPYGNTDRDKEFMRGPISEIAPYESFFIPDKSVFPNIKRKHQVSNLFNSIYGYTEKEKQLGNNGEIFIVPEKSWFPKLRK